MTENSIAPICPELFAQLQLVEPSTDGVVAYRPCSILTSDGQRLEKVYVVEAISYKLGWGVWPWDDEAKSWVKIEDVVELHESPHRLPAALANRLYEAGESGMGYTMFTVILHDGRKLPYVAGNAVDFPAWPPGISPAMVKEIEPHSGREHFRGHTPTEFESTAPYVWCVFAPPAADESR